ncbi:MAG: replicative DNA helicase [Alphaproteobacteria bacterium]
MDPSRQAAALSVLARGEDAEQPLFRAQPHNLEAEQALLGALLVDNGGLDRVSGYLSGEHFFQPVHGRIYDAIVHLTERGQLADPITLKAYFEQDGALVDIGGAEYLVRLVASAISIINVNDYGRQIHDRALRRSLIRIGEGIVNTAFDFEVDDPATAQIENAEQRLFDLAERGEIEGGFAPLSRALAKAIESAERAYKHESKVTGVPTGFSGLDALLGGLHPSDLIVLAGRPGMGKTALASNIAFHAAKTFAQRSTRGDPASSVGIFSLEMSGEQLAARILSEESNVPSHSLRVGKLTQDEFDRLVVASQQLTRLPLFIDDSPALSVAALRTRARRLKRVHHLSLVVVDYLQLVRPSSGARGYDNRVQEVAEITQGLKAMAKELDVPVLALSQLSRAVEQREDKRPQLSDLRESGTIEQDADVVMFIFREEYYLRQAEPKPRTSEEDSDSKFQTRYERWTKRLEEVTGTTDLIVAKHRHGPTSNVQLYFNSNTTKFGNLETRYDPGDFPV